MPLIQFNVKLVIICIMLMTLVLYFYAYRWPTCVIGWCDWCEFCTGLCWTACEQTLAAAVMLLQQLTTARRDT